MGYLVSPLLSRTLAGNRFAGLSAGRVQSVALRFLCDREKEIARFVPEEYWEIEVVLENGDRFKALVTKKDGEKMVVRTAKEADAVERALRKAKLVVASVDERDRQRHPAPPFITSSLQQAASSFLGFSPKRTMAVAQELYEGIGLPEGSEGLITYMRTDSVRLSDEAVAAARESVRQTYGEKYLSAAPRAFENKRKSQDAHEAIRPTDVERTPDVVANYLTPEQLKLYRLIYGRFLATQMASAVYRQRSVAVQAAALTLEASGSELAFDGFLRALPERREKEATFPPKLDIGQTLSLVEVAKLQKFTEPPRRFSEAGLVNVLEKEGIGRPSTYASIVSVIQDRGYAVKDGASIRPTLLGHMVVDFLAQYFSETVEPKFTAHLEEDLDRIEEGEMTRLDALDEFYGPFSARLSALESMIETAEERPFRVPTDVACSECGGPMELRYWKGSHFLGCSNYPECRKTVSLPPDLDVVYGSERVEVQAALDKAARSTAASQECPKCGRPDGASFRTVWTLLQVQRRRVRSNCIGVDRRHLPGVRGGNARREIRSEAPSHILQLRSLPQVSVCHERPSRQALPVVRKWRARREIRRAAVHDERVRPPGRPGGRCGAAASSYAASDRSLNHSSRCLRSES